MTELLGKFKLEGKVAIITGGASMGISSLERHITLDRAMYGTDQAASIDASQLKNLAGALRKVSLILGDGKKEIRKSEIPIRKKLRIEIK